MYLFRYVMESLTALVSQNSLELNHNYSTTLRQFCHGNKGKILSASGGCLQAFCDKNAGRHLPEFCLKPRSSFCCLPVSGANNWVSVIVIDHCSLHHCWILHHIHNWTGDVGHCCHCYHCSLNHWNFLHHIEVDVDKFVGTIHWSLKYLPCITNYQPMTRIVMNKGNHFVLMKLCSLLYTLWLTHFQVKSKAMTKNCQSIVCCFVIWK